METYKASELIVLHLDAGNDRNGNPRRIFVLAHPLAGYLAATDKGYSGTGALCDFAVTFQVDGRPAQALDIQNALRDRVTPRIDTSPSYRKRLLSASVQETMKARNALVVI